MRCISIVFFALILLLQAATGFSQHSTAAGDATLNMYRGSVLNLKANSANAFAFQWFRDGQMILDAVNPDYAVTESGSYTVISFNQQNCSSQLSNAINVIVWPKNDQKADLRITKTAEERGVLLNEPFWYTINIENKGPDEAKNVVVKDELPVSLELIDMPFTENIQSGYRTTERTAYWELPSLASGDTKTLRLSVKATETGSVTNLAYINSDVADPDPDNNTASHVKDIYGIRLPNVFTPNDDGVNDTYRIAGLENYPENEFTVVNRWGNHVFETRSYQGDWTGDSLNEGTYFYVLKIKTGDRWEVFKGFITLIRNKK